MKKIIILPFILLAVLLSSCGKDFLDSKPTSNIITELAITNVTEAKYAINGIYDYMSSSGYYGATMQMYGDVKGDDLQSYVTERTTYYMYIFDHRANNLNGGRLWSRPFMLIRQATNIINAIESGKVSDGTEAERNAIKGHAIALRAMAHFDLTKCFGYPYAKDGGASWGVPIIDHVLDMDEYPLRNTVKECYDFIIKQFALAIPMMSTEKDAGKMNAYGARVLLARAYLYSTDWQSAFNTASAVIEELKANNTFTLYTNANYMASFAFDARLGSESLMEIINSGTDNQSWDGLSYLIHPFGYKACCLTKSFEDLMTSDPEDVRNGMIRIVADRNNRPFLNKYPGLTPKDPSKENNYPILRLSEAYLIAAEAATHLSGADRAKGLGYLNDIVKRGNPKNNVSDAGFDLDRVLTERRKELVGEGHRYFDLLRNGKKIVRQGGYHLPNVQEEVDWDFYKCVLPIPAEQFTFNPEMQQNPEYQKK